MYNLNKILRDVMNDAIKLNIPISENIDKNVYIDIGVVERMGACYRNFDKYEIHISQKLTKAKLKYIKSIIAHEVLHTCFLSMDHFYPWSKYCDMMNSKYGYEIQVKYNWNEII